MSTHGITPRGEARRLQEGVERMPDLDWAGAGEAGEERSGRRRRRARESHVRSNFIFYGGLPYLFMYT